MGCTASHPPKTRQKGYWRTSHAERRRQLIEDRDTQLKLLEFAKGARIKGVENGDEDGVRLLDLSIIMVEGEVRKKNRSLGEGGQYWKP